jgi:hypothetical protein
VYRRLCGKSSPEVECEGAAKKRIGTLKRRKLVSELEADGRGVMDSRRREVRVHHSLGRLQATTPMAQTRLLLTRYPVLFQWPLANHLRRY